MKDKKLFIMLCVIGILFFLNISFYCYIRISNIVESNYESKYDESQRVNSIKMDNIINNNDTGY